MRLIDFFFFLNLVSSWRILSRFVLYTNFLLFVIFLVIITSTVECAIIFKVFIVIPTITPASTFFTVAVNILLILILIWISFSVTFKILFSYMLLGLFIAVWMLVTLFKHHSHLSSVLKQILLSRIFWDQISTRIIMVFLSVVANTFFIWLILLIHSFPKKCTAWWANLGSSPNHMLFTVCIVLLRWIVVILVFFFIFMD